MLRSDRDGAGHRTAKPGRIKSALLSWLGIPVHLTDSEFWANFGTESSSGQSVTDRTMLQLSTVWACARLISETIATLPLGLYERTTAGRREAKGHPLYPIIHSRPNTDSTASVFWEAVVAAMLLRGNARAEVQLIDGRLVGMKFLAPGRLSAPRRVNGRVLFRYTERDGRQREIAAERIFRIPGFSTDGEEGLSVVQYGANVFGAALAADTAAAKTFANGLLPTTYFKIDRVLKPEQRTEFRENLAKITGALNAGKSPLLEAGMDVGDVGINPTDAQLLESRAWGVEEICRWFRVPPWMVGHTEKGSSWGTGMEQQMIGFLTFTLLPWLRRIEQAISKDLLSPVDQQRYYVEFAIEGLLRADSASRAAYYGVMINNGVYTRDEVRVKENMPPRGGNADVLTVQSAMVPLDQIGRNPDSEQARAALSRWLTEPNQE